MLRTQVTVSTSVEQTIINDWAEIFISNGEITRITLSLPGGLVVSMASIQETETFLYGALSVINKYKELVDQAKDELYRSQEV